MLINFPYYDYMITMPRFSPIDMRPPSVYELLNSIVNYGKSESEQKNVTELAKIGRTTFFDFNYPLTDKISKEEFEEMILNHYMMRRIGFDTLTAFKIQLNVKLNEIMPMYNKLLDSIEGWNLFNDGEKEVRVADNTTNLQNTSNSTSSNTSDRRNSEMPQNKLEEIRNGEYITDYNYDTNSNIGNDSSTSNGTSNTTETVTRSPSNKLEIYKEFIQNKQNIYSMIFKDLDVLFYGLI